MVADKQVFQSASLPRVLPFSSVVRGGDTLYVSGNLGNVPGKFELVAGGVAAETRQALANIRESLAIAGSSLDRVLKCTVFLADMADFQAMNDAYRDFFPIDPPARSTVAVKALAMNARVEIECVALAAK
ncbi:MAG: RidA family protein [Candidatus Binataceae bacterium]